MTPFLQALPFLLFPLVEGRPDLTTITTIATTFTTLYRPQPISPTTPFPATIPSPPPNDQTSDPETLSRALTTANLLLHAGEGNNWYNATTGLWQDLWWNSGNIVTTLARLSQVIDEGEETKDVGEEARGWRDSVIEFLKREREFEVAERGTGGGQGWTRGFFDDGGWVCGFFSLVSVFYFFFFFLRQHFLPTPSQARVNKLTCPVGPSMDPSPRPHERCPLSDHSGRDFRRSDDGVECDVRGSVVG